MSKSYFALSLITVFVLLIVACSPQAPTNPPAATEEPSEPTEVMTEPAASGTAYGTARIRRTQGFAPLRRRQRLWDD